MNYFPFSLPLRERDEFEVELIDLKKQMAYMEAAHQGVCRERNELSAEVWTIIIEKECSENHMTS